MAQKRKFKTPKQQPFQAPGTLTYIGKEIQHETLIILTKYNLEKIRKTTIQHVTEEHAMAEAGKRIWLDVDGVHQIEVIEQIGKAFNLHPLLLEDVLNTTQKPKIEYYEEENQLFIVLKMLYWNEETWEADSEQIALILGENYVISFQEYDQTDIFENLHERIKQETSRIRRYQSDYLIYAMIDLVVDHYFILIENITDKLENLEEAVLHEPDPTHQNKAYLLKKEINFMKRNILPLRDMINALIREESNLVGKQVNVYLRDVQDHVVQTIETLDNYRDVADNIMMSYHAALSNKMNSVMKTLTVFTVIFMPLSFIAGLYGMNFKNMPELNTENGYYFSLAGMAVIAIGLWIYFKWKKYL